ncbi:MAG: pyridoxamine 5'-phosphate oxidase family protein [Burkholderiales bacterium]|nr:pyridoxamine 5'-phosphate oxidase family protein [Burkholderiales bacterium]
MAKFYAALTDELMDFIRAQRLFFTGTAAADGRINVSPKGMQTLRILDAQRVAYLDLTGSSAETAAHLRADGRLTLMFNSFDDAPLILRLYGKGALVMPDDAEWAALYNLFPPIPGARQIVVLTIESLQTSCGFGVPRYEYNGERDDLVNWANKKGEDGLRQYRADKNRISIDGLPTGLGG